MKLNRRTLLGSVIAASAIGVFPKTAFGQETSSAAVVAAVELPTKPFKVAVVQAESPYLDLAAGVTKTISLIEEAAAGGAALVAFPELWLPGYPFGHETPEWKAKYLQTYVDNSLQIGSPEWDAIREAAAQNNIMVSLGISEKADDHLYITQALIDADGTPVQVRRKIRPSGGERTVWSDSGPENLKVIPTRLGRVGQLSCWEHMRPQSTFIMQAQKENIHIGAWPILPTVEGYGWAAPDVNLAAARFYTTTSGAVNLVPCALVGPSTLEHFQSIEGSKWVTLGGGAARIYGGFGLDLAKPLAETEEGILYAEVDPSRFSTQTENPEGEFSHGVLGYIDENYPTSRVPDTEHTTLNLVSISALLKA